jgi:phosphatidylglycerophosphatase A
MNEKTDAPTPSAASPAPPARKPRVALFVATACGLGYIPFAPGTWGSLAGLALVMLPWWGFFAVGIISRDETLGRMSILGGREFDPFLGAQIWIALILAGLGVWSASRAAKFWAEKDPQRVVIDEVSGQHLTLFLGSAVPVWTRPFEDVAPGVSWGQVSIHSALSWKYLLLGLILFRLFDIWKPFPVRQAESLPGGWGIMADDWVAAIYAGLGLWIARAAGL